MGFNIGRTSATLIAAGAIALAGAGTAFAGLDNDFYGPTKGDPESYVGFDRNRVEGRRVLERINVQVRTKCMGGEAESEAVGEAAGRVIVRDGGKFAAQRKYRNFFHEDSNATIAFSGKVVSRDVVRGSLRIKEVRPGTTEGDTIRCNTGLLEFRVTRGGPPQ